MKKDFELMAVQHETSEASLRKRHQEAVNDLSDQLDQTNKHRAKSVQSSFTIIAFVFHLHWHRTSSCRFSCSSCSSACSWCRCIIVVFLLLSSSSSSVFHGLYRPDAPIIFLKYVVVVVVVAAAAAVVVVVLLYFMVYTDLVHRSSFKFA